LKFELAEIFKMRANVGVTFRNLSKHPGDDSAAVGVACGVRFLKFDVEENAGHKRPFSKSAAARGPFTQPRFARPLQALERHGLDAGQSWFDSERQKRTHDWIKLGGKVTALACSDGAHAWRQDRINLN
jgi:hypothetical protein